MGAGLTDLYNRFHEKNNVDSDIVCLRELHQEMDELIIQTYGWGDINLGHDFHEVPYLAKNDCVRFTISDSARLEVLRRLSELNYQRYEEEVTQGLHGNAVARARRHRANSAPMQPSFDFDSESVTTDSSEGVPGTAILGFLSTHDGWYAKADVLAVTGITDGQWNVAISELVSDGKVERQGERRGARYRFVGGGQ